MPSIQIKHVPDETHRVLQARAVAADQSLQQYLRALLVDEAARPTLDEALDRIESYRGGSAPPDLVVDLIRADRAER